MKGLYSRWMDRISLIIFWISYDLAERDVLTRKAYFSGRRVFLFAHGWHTQSSHFLESGWGDNHSVKGLYSRWMDRIYLVNFWISYELAEREVFTRKAYFAVRTVFCLLTDCIRSLRISYKVAEVIITVWRAVFEVDRIEFTWLISGFPVTWLRWKF